MATKKTPKPTDPTVDTLPVVEDKSPRTRIRHQNPKVADHVAKVLIKHAMDMQSAVRELAPELTPTRAAEVAELLAESASVKDAIEKNLRARGLDEDSKNVFVQKMWRWLDAIEDVIVDEKTGEVDMLATMAHRSSMKDFALNAARILSKGFISDRAVSDKPAMLPIKGWSEGVSQMLGGEPATVSPVASATPATPEKDPFDA